MSSKWRPWDFLKHHPDVIDKSKKGLSVIYCADPFVEKILRGRIDFEAWEGRPALNVSGGDLTIDWIEENIKSLSLFGGDEPICVLQAHTMIQSVRRYLLENEISDETRQLVFFMNGEKKFFNEWEKKSAGTFLEVEEPKFWEYGKLLTYFADEMSMRLPMDVHQYLVDAVPHNSADFINTLKTIRLSFGTGPYKVADLKKVIPSTRLDQFRLASLLSKKQMVEFYRELEKLSIDSEEQIGFYSFLQGHLFKLMDPSYVKKKARPSKYDKEIQANSTLWKRDELQNQIRSFAKLEIEAKKKSPYIKEKIRELLIAEL